MLQLLPAHLLATMNNAALLNSGLLHSEPVIHEYDTNAEGTQRGNTESASSSHLIALQPLSREELLSIVLRVKFMLKNF